MYILLVSMRLGTFWDLVQLGQTTACFRSHLGIFQTAIRILTGRWRSVRLTRPAGTFIQGQKSLWRGLFLTGSTITVIGGILYLATN